MIEEAAVLVVEDDENRLLPLWARRQRVINRKGQVLAIVDIRRRMVVILFEAEWIEVAEARVDPRYLRQRTLGGVLQKASVVCLDAYVQPRLPRQIGLGEVRELAVVAETVELVGHP
jgi:hypothetical protein